jgi:hypothetical protein
MYPADFRRAFGRELAVTFRNRVEDVLDGGSVLDWCAFAGHIVIDCIRTCSTLTTAPRPRASLSQLGLSDGDAAYAYMDRTTVDIARVFAAAGIVLAGVVWYTYMTYVILGRSVL